ncbi:unnamed protein product [Allacma fusca]|uniref:Uncharacterized protein n=1 Tax=Allacma fusca TaxID=39272 RepID=A0A8J2J2F0_9HEXA|nr:unnamed protein product [Allacma fusca]
MRLPHVIFPMKHIRDVEERAMTIINTISDFELEDFKQRLFFSRSHYTELTKFTFGYVSDSFKFSIQSKPKL